MSEIFLSYERLSASQAQTVARALRALGYGVWLDDELPAHRAYEEVIKEQLHSAKAVVVIWSAEAAKSEWVRSEANQAREAHKLVQLTIDNAPLPMPFDQIQCADMNGWTGDLNWSGWRKVLLSIAELTGRAVTTQIAAMSMSTRKNSICVLPFVNMSGDAEQEYFSDGISEDIITDLSKVSALFVIARNTAFTFKARSVDVPQVARQLNVSHVLEGSVRKAGGRVRITAQLIDGATGGHLWAERYDRDLTDIFALQDEIAAAIVEALKLKLLPEEKKVIERRGTSNLEAYDLYLRGTRPAFAQDERRDRIVLLEASTRLAPDYADGWGALAHARSMWRFYRPYAERDEIAATVAAEAERALALDSHNAAALWAQYNLLPPFGRFVDRDVLLNHMEVHGLGDARSVFLRSPHLLNVGRMREAIEVAQHAYAMDPLDHAAANWRGLTLLWGGRYAEARWSLEGTLARWAGSQFAASNLNAVYVETQDWGAVDALLAPERLAQFPLREYERPALGFASVMRDLSPASRRRPIEAARRRFEASGYAEFLPLQLAAHVGAVDEAHAIAAKAKFGPAGNDRDVMGTDAYRPGWTVTAPCERDRCAGLRGTVACREWWLAGIMADSPSNQYERHAHGRSEAQSRTGPTHQARPSVGLFE